MLGGAKDVVAGISFKARTKALDRASRKLNDLQNELRNAGASSVAMARGADDASSSTGRLATQSGVASGSLAGLQSQLVATAGATETLERNSGDLNDAFDEMSGTELTATLQGISDTIDDIDDDLMTDALDIGDEKKDAQEFLDILKELDEMELREVVKYGASGGEEGSIQHLAERTEEDVEAIKKAQNELEAIGDIKGSDAVMEAISETDRKRSALRNYLDDAPAQFDPDDISFIGGEIEKTEGPFPFSMLQDDVTVGDIIASSDDEFADLITPSARESGLLDETTISEMRKFAVKNFRKSDGFFDALIGSDDTPIGEVITRDVYDQGKKSRVNKIAGQIVPENDPTEQGIFNVLAEADTQLGGNATIEDALAMDDDVLVRAFEDAYGRVERDMPDSLKNSGYIRSLVATRAAGDDINPSPNSLGRDETHPYDRKPQDIFGDNLEELGENIVDLDNSMSGLLDEYDVDSVSDFFDMDNPTLYDFLNDAGFDGFDSPYKFRETLVKDLADKGMIDASPANIGKERSFLDVVKNEGKEAFIDSAGMPHDFSRGSDSPDPPHWQILSGELTELARLMDESEAIANAVIGSDDIGEAVRNLRDTDPAKMERFVGWMNENSENLQDFFNAFGQGGVTGRALPDDTEELSNLIQNGMDGEMLRPSEDPDKIAEPADLNDFQSRMLARITSDLDDVMGGNRGGSGELPITYEALFMSLQQEMLDAEKQSSSQFRESEGLLQLLSAGQLTDLGFLQTPEGRQTVEETLKDSLPDDATELLAGGNQGVSVPALVADAMGEMEANREQSGLLFELLDPESSTTASGPVGKALSGKQLSDNTSIEQITRLVERSLPDIYRQLGSEVAPGMTMTSAFDNDDLRGLLPPKEVQQFALSEGSGSGATEFSEAFDQYISDLERSMERLKNVQRRNRTLVGFSLDELPLVGRMLDSTQGPGRANRQRGVFGAALGPLTRIFSSQGFNKPRHTSSLIDTMTTMKNGFQDIVPLFDATSLNLGPLNVNFETLTVMVFKLTAMLGPLTMSLLGLAGAAGTAAAALGGLIAAGAIDFFAEMEDTMAGVENKGDAVQEVMGTVKDMAFEALDPLREVRVGGATGQDLFVGAIRGSLVLLNRFADIMSQVVQRDAFINMIKGINDFVYDRSGDDTFASELGDALDQMLPILADIVSAFTGGFGPALEYAAWLGSTLIDQLIETLGELGPVLRLISAYGAGFIYTILVAAEYIAMFINFLTDLVGVFASVLSILPGVSGEVRELAFGFGMVAGSIYVASTAFSIFLAKGAGALKFLGGLVAVLKYVTAGLYSATTALKAYTVATVNAKIATYGFAKGLALLAAKLTIVLGIAVLVHDALATFTGLDAVMFDLGKLTSAVTILSFAAVVIGKIVTGASAFTVAMMGAAQVVGAIVLFLGKVAAFIAGGITLSTVGWVAVLVGAVIALGSIIEYLLTGESTLANWAMQFEVVENTVSKIADMIDYIVTKIQKARDFLRGGNDRRSANFMTNFSAHGNPFGPMLQDLLANSSMGDSFGYQGTSAMIGLDTGGYLKSSGLAMLHEGEQVLSESDVNRGAGAGGSTTVNVRMENNGAIGMRDLDRWIEQKFSELFRQRGSPEF